MAHMRGHHGSERACSNDMHGRYDRPTGVVDVQPRCRSPSERRQNTQSSEVTRYVREIATGAVALAVFPLGAPTHRPRALTYRGGSAVVREYFHTKWTLVRMCAATPPAFRSRSPAFLAPWGTGQGGSGGAPQQKFSCLTFSFCFRRRFPTATRAASHPKTNIKHNQCRCK